MNRHDGYKGQPMRSSTPRVAHSDGHTHTRRKGEIQADRQIETVEEECDESWGGGGIYPLSITLCSLCGQVGMCFIYM